MSTTADVECDGNNISNGFSNIERMRFRTLTYEIIEELRMRRDQDVENERKIQHLLQDKFELGKKLDIELAKLANKEEQHDSEIRETRRQMEDKIREFKIDASQQQVARKIAEKESESLKEEIRKLQLTNYALQKQIRDHERYEKVQTTEREQHIRQMSQFESQFKQVTSLTKEVGTKQMKLEKDIKEVEHLNHLLRYQNHHNKCIINLKNDDIARLQEQIVSSGVSQKASIRGVKEKERELLREVTLLKEKNATTQKQCDELTQDAESWKTKYWDSLKSLEEAHRLVSVNLHNSAQYKQDCEEAEEEKKVTAETLERVEEDLCNVRGQLERLQEEKTRSEEEWLNQKSQLEKNIERLNEEISSQEEKYATLERENAEIKGNNGELKEEIDKLQAVLNRERSEFCTQTELSLLCVTDKDAQASPDTTSKEIQTDSKSISFCFVQTINPAMCCSVAQTDQVELTETEVQTHCSETSSRDTQTDIQLQDVLLMANQESDHSAKVQTDSVDVVHQFTQTDTLEPEPRVGSSNIPGQQASVSLGEELNLIDRQNESVPFEGFQTEEDQNLCTIETKSTNSYTPSGSNCDPGDGTLPGFNEKLLATNDFEPKTVADQINFNIGISVKDLNVKANCGDIANSVIIDPEDYALTLTPQVKKDQPIRDLDTEECDAEVMEILIGQDTEDGGVTNLDNYTSSDTRGVIGESDDDDFVAPTQPSQRLKKSKDKLQIIHGPVKHKLSLPKKEAEKMVDSETLGTEKEIDCTAAKQMKHSDKELDRVDSNELTADRINEMNSNYLSYPLERNRIVVRSGQKAEIITKLEDNFVGMVDRGSENQKHMDIQRKFLDFDKSNMNNNEVDSRMASIILSENSNSTMTSEHFISSFSASKFVHDNVSAMMVPLTFSGDNTANITGTLPTSVKPLISLPHSTILSAKSSSSYSETPSLASRTSLDQPTSFYTSAMTSTSNILPKSGVFVTDCITVSSESGPIPIVETDVSSTETSRVSTTDSAPSQMTNSGALESSTAVRADSEPSILQKYREIMSKIKPVASLQIQPAKKPSGKKGKTLYSGSLGAAMLPAPHSSAADESANQFSADWLSARGSLRGILKGATPKEKGSKSVSWNS